MKGVFNNEHLLRVCFLISQSLYMRSEANMVESTNDNTGITFNPDVKNFPLTQGGVDQNANSLICSYGDESSQLYITWLKEDIELVNEIKGTVFQLHEDKKARIYFAADVTPDDSGTYTCKVTTTSVTIKDKDLSVCVTNSTVTDCAFVTSTTGKPTVTTAISPSTDKVSSSASSATTTLTTTSGSTLNNTGLIVGCVIGVLFIIAVIVGVYFYLRRRKLNVKAPTSEKPFSNPKTSTQPLPLSGPYEQITLESDRNIVTSNKGIDNQIPSTKQPMISNYEQIPLQSERSVITTDGSADNQINSTNKPVISGPYEQIDLETEINIPDPKADDDIDIHGYAVVKKVHKDATKDEDHSLDITHSETETDASKSAYQKLVLDQAHLANEDEGMYNRLFHNDEGNIVTSQEAEPADLYAVIHPRKPKLVITEEEQSTKPSERESE